MRPEATADTKMMYLIRRREGTTREELVAHWFANHMPIVIDRQKLQASAGKLAASRYIATLFDPGSAPDPDRWDGVAQLWFAVPLPQPRSPHGDVPTDSFQERAEPYLPWATTEYVVVDGSLPVQPLTLNPPFPCTRSGFLKVTFLVTAAQNVNHDAFFEHWLEVHAPRAGAVLEEVGGLRYVLSLSQDPGSAPYAGMAELYFPGPEEWADSQAALVPDGLDQYIERVDLLNAGTEMIGIP